MTLARRHLLTALGAGLANCARRGPIAPRAGALDTLLLDGAFPALAARARPGDFNLGVLEARGERLWCWNPDKRMPMQSVFKAPLAAATLAEVDAGRLRLDERIPIGALDLSPPPGAIDRAWPSPPEGHTMNVPAIDLIALAVQQSDNTAADVIMKRIGGPGAVTAWLRAKGIADMSVNRYERELQQELAGMESFRPAWKDEAAWLAARDAVPAAIREGAMNAYLADPRDTTTVPAALGFLYKLSQGDLISPASTRLLLRLMSATATGAGRLAAGLPPDESLAHKTGSARTDLGFTPATNDIGLVTLKDGRKFAIAAFLAGSTATQAERDRLIADAARLAVKAMG
ncbi:MAG: class A beta-lactamase [Pseudomonadota bacterium]|nr:class A beta-lactamase [Pseudomonadota bacterium]